MTERTSDSEDFADYTDDHQDKEPVRAARLEKDGQSTTPDVAPAPEQEPPD